jgi:hypothetical protein
MFLHCEFIALCLFTCLIVGCTGNRSAHQQSSRVSSIAEINAMNEIAALKEEIAVARTAIEQLTNSLSQTRRGEWVARSMAAKEKSYPVRKRYQDLLTEIDILRRRAQALRIERSEYDRALLLHR